MIVQRFSFTQGRWDQLPALDSEQTLVLVFADPSFRGHDEAWKQLWKNFSRSTILGCSTAGSIAREEVRDESIEGVAVQFERSTLCSATVSLEDNSDSYRAGKLLGESLRAEGLRAVFLLGDGLSVNGSKLINGLNETLPEGTTVSGGLAADGSRFMDTWIVTRDFVGSKRVAAVGFYGEHLHVSHGSRGGFDKFGVERRVTRAEGPVLYELDGQPALKLYKSYLGEQAQALPASGMLFPLAIRDQDSSQTVVRTILGVNEEQQSIQFAGDIPTGSLAQLMKANIDRLVEGAGRAAEDAAEGSTESIQGLAIAISCLGRRLVMKGRVEEELEAMEAIFPAGVEQIGFYSYGEIAPTEAENSCQLHNQTMTVTLLHE